MENLKIGFCMCGSFCTFKDAFNELKNIKAQRADIYPIISNIVKITDTRFGTAYENIRFIEQCCGKSVISTIDAAEPIGPKKLLDILVVCPCTGNTLAKIANGITDSPVTMAVKAHLRNERPVVLSIASNDGLGASAANIAKLLNTKNIFFVPFGQDDPVNKSKSLISDFTKLIPTINKAILGEQIQPIMLKW